MSEFVNRMCDLTSDLLDTNVVLRCFCAGNRVSVLLLCVWTEMAIRRAPDERFPVLHLKEHYKFKCNISNENNSNEILQDCLSLLSDAGLFRSVVCWFHGVFCVFWTSGIKTGLWLKCCSIKVGYQFDLESWESLGKVEQLSTRFTFTLHLHHSLPAERGNEEVIQFFCFC